MNFDSFSRVIRGAVALLFLAGGLEAQINFVRDTYAQPFNGLISSGSVTLEGSSNIGQSVPLSGLQGWYAAKLGGSGTADMTLNADDGTLNGGRLYSYGTPDSVERALGFKGSGTHFGAVGAAFFNATNQTVTSVTITFSHEIWSVQGTTTNAAFEDRLSFAWGLSSAGITTDDFLSNASMTPAPVLDAVSSSARALTGVTDAASPPRARDGNAEDERQVISATIENVSWEPGETLFIRWQDSDTGGYDAGHGIDDFKIEAGGSQHGSRRPVPTVSAKADGDFFEWDGHPGVHLDPEGDSRTEGGIDFLAMGGEVGADGLTLYIRSADPHVFSNSNLSIYLDTDGDQGTGTAFGGLGADLLLSFSIFQEDQRFFPAEAVYYPEGVRLPFAEAISDFLPNGLNAYTTHPESNEIELLIPLAALRGLTPGGRIGILLRDRVGDFAPDLGETFHIDVPHNVMPVGKISNFDKVDPADIRVACWNVLVNGPYNLAKEAAFGRQIAATRPDIVHFQELYEAPASWAIGFMNRWYPLEEGKWYAAKNSDCITVSRFEILDFWRVDANLLVLLDTEAEWGFNSLFFNAHTPAHVENQQPRISETTNFMLLLRRLVNGTEPGAPEGPFATFVVGDLNANAPKLELSTFRTGKFVSSAYSSLNYWPDQYGLPLVDTAPRHTHTSLPRLFTWRSLTSGNTQRLDYIYYQQSRLTLQKSFVVDTTTMPADFREAYNLESGDTSASDHLLLIADFKPREVPFAWAAQDVQVPGWFHSGWLGWMYAFSESDYFSSLHQNLHARPDENGVWIWDDALDWWFTHADLYPYAYKYATSSWILFNPSDTQPRWYYDFATQSWISE